MANDRGRRHTNGPANGQEELFRPLRRRLEPARTGADQGTAEGKRYVGEPRGQDLLRPERRHIPQAAERSGYDIPEQTLNWTKRGRVMWDSGPAQHWVSTERTLEIECGMKIKPRTLYEKVRRFAARRSWVGARAPAWKAFVPLFPTPRGGAAQPSSGEESGRQGVRRRRVFRRVHQRPQRAVRRFGSGRRQRRAARPATQLRGEKTHRDPPRRETRHRVTPPGAGFLRRRAIDSKSTGANLAVSCVMYVDVLSFVYRADILRRRSARRAFFFSCKLSCAAHRSWRFRARVLARLGAELLRA